MMDWVGGTHWGMDSWGEPGGRWRCRKRRGEDQKGGTGDCFLDRVKKWFYLYSHFVSLPEVHCSPSLFIPSHIYLFPFPSHFLLSVSQDSVSLFLPPSFSSTPFLSSVLHYLYYCIFFNFPLSFSPFFSIPTLRFHFSFFFKIGSQSSTYYTYFFPYFPPALPSFSPLTASFFPALQEDIVNNMTNIHLVRNAAVPIRLISLTRNVKLWPSHCVVV